jgi:hypothetical protein
MEWQVLYKRGTGYTILLHIHVCIMLHMSIWANITSCRWSGNYCIKGGRGILLYSIYMCVHLYYITCEHLNKYYKLSMEWQVLYKRGTGYTILLHIHVCIMLPVIIWTNITSCRWSGKYCIKGGRGILLYSIYMCVLCYLWAFEQILQVADGVASIV